MQTGTDMFRIVSNSLHESPAAMGRIICLSSSLSSRITTPEPPCFSRDRTYRTNNNGDPEVAAVDWSGTGATGHVHKDVRMVSASNNITANTIVSQ